MKIYKLENKSSFLIFVHEENSRDFRLKFIGKPMKDDWNPVWVEEERRNSKKYDMSLFCSNPVFNEKTVEALRDLMEDKVEILPFLHKIDKYYGINVTNMIDCVDITNSDVTTDTKYNVITDIHRYCFIESMVAAETIFKIPQFKKTFIFVTDRFRDRVLESKLTGFEFREVWDSEAPLVQEEPVNPLVFEGPTYTFKQASALVEQGKTMASDKWVMQQHKNTMYLGTFERNGTFSWIDPIYIPPILLDLKWYIVEKLEIPE